jgi:hypothetical protein
VVKGKEKYLQTKYRPAVILLNVNAIILLKLKLKFMNNKKLILIIVNFHQVYAKNT